MGTWKWVRRNIVRMKNRITVRKKEPSFLWHFLIWRHFENGDWYRTIANRKAKNDYPILGTTVLMEKRVAIQIPEEAKKKANIIQWIGCHLVMDQEIVLDCDSPKCTYELFLLRYGIVLNFRSAQKPFYHLKLMKNLSFSQLKVPSILVKSNWNPITKRVQRKNKQIQIYVYNRCFI